jgi:hypothetical protein
MAAILEVPCDAATDRVLASAFWLSDRATQPSGVAVVVPLFSRALD